MATTKIELIESKNGDRTTPVYGNCANLYDTNDDMCVDLIEMVEDTEHPLLIFEMRCSNFRQELPGGQP